MLLIVDEKAFKGPFQPILWSYGLKTPTWVHMAAVPSGICPTLPILSGFDPQQGRAQPPPAPRARPGREVEFETIGTRLPAEVQSLIEESCSFIPTKHKQAVLWWQTFQQLRGCRSERSRTSMLKAQKKGRRRPRVCKSPLAGSRMGLGAHAQNLHICDGPESCTR